MAKGCNMRVISDIFNVFQKKYSTLRLLNPTQDPIVVKLGDKETKFSHQDFGERLEAYSQTTRGADGKWITVQVRRWLNFSEFYAIEIFNDKGKSVALVRDFDCGAYMLISPKAKKGRKDIFIQSALFAVTGKNYYIIVADWLKE